MLPTFMRVYDLCLWKRKIKGKKDENSKFLMCCTSYVLK